MFLQANCDAPGNGTMLRILSNNRRVWFWFRSPTLNQLLKKRLEIKKTKDSKIIYECNYAEFVSKN